MYIYMCVCTTSRSFKEGGSSAGTMLRSQRLSISLTGPGCDPQHVILELTCRVDIGRKAKDVSTALLVVKFESLAGKRRHLSRAMREIECVEETDVRNRIRRMLRTRS